MNQPHNRPSETVIHLLLASCEHASDCEALVLDGRRISYSEYLAAVCSLAGQLADIGVAGERVATVLPNGLDTCIVSFASWMAGAQLAPLNPLYTERELGEILADAQPKVLFSDESIAADLTAVCQTPSISLHLDRHIVSSTDQHTFLESLANHKPSDFTELAPQQLGLLQYTGGTTGRAKGVDLSHGAIAYNVYQRECALPTIAKAERILCAMPLFHAYGFSMGLLLAANCAGSLVIRSRYQPEDLLRQFGAEKITIFPGAPTIYNGLVAHDQFQTSDFRTLHTCYSGSAPLAVDTLERWTAVTRAPIYEGYGQTEAGPVLTFNQVDRAIKPGTVGEAVIDTVIELVDTESGQRLDDVGAVGEIRARGPQLMRGYRGRPDETARALRDGWLYTGDLGEFDEDGYLIIRDRLKDMVIVGGYNVYPREIDDVLFMHPWVVDAAAVGAADSYRGEVIRAYVVVSEGLNDDPNSIIESLNEHCKKNLARYKRPVSIELMRSLPKTTVNKTDKTMLRKRF